MYRFPGRALIDRLLVLPLAMPTYIAAYCYVELLDFSGPLQSALRAIFGWHTVRDYWFPDVRSLGGAIIVLSAVLYPYVYLSARASFVQQSICVLEVARTLGQTPAGAFWRVALPLARPALAAGLALALMECMNDLGAVQYLGVPDPHGQHLCDLAAALEPRRRGADRAGGAAVRAGAHAGGAMGARSRAVSPHHRALPLDSVLRPRGLACICCDGALRASVCGRVRASVRDASAAGRRSRLAMRWPQASGGRLRTASALPSRPRSSPWRWAWCSPMPGASRQTCSCAARCGPPASATRCRARCWRSACSFRSPRSTTASTRCCGDGSGLSTGLLLSGSLFVVILAYVIRFLAVSLSALEAGFARLSPNLDAAARALGETAFTALWRVHMPLLVPVLGAAALLVFVDADEGAARHLAAAALQFRDAGDPRLCLRGAGAIRERDAGRPDHRADRPRCRCCCCTRQWRPAGRAKAWGRMRRLSNARSR